MVFSHDAVKSLLSLLSLSHIESVGDFCYFSWDIDQCVDQRCHSTRSGLDFSHKQQTYSTEGE